MILRPGDRFLLCTDGLYDLVSDFDIQAILADSPPDAAVKDLIEAARNGGGHDNITAAVVLVQEEEENRPPVNFKATREFSLSE